MLLVAILATVTCMSLSPAAQFEHGAPGGEIVQTRKIQATVSGIDQKKHPATLLFSDGTRKRIAVCTDVGLTRHKVGETVGNRVTEIFAVLMEKP